MSSIYALRETELSPTLAPKLWPFINAYRPHDEPRSWKVLREEGLEKIEPESTWDLIEEQHIAMTEGEEE